MEEKISIAQIGYGIFALCCTTFMAILVISSCLVATVPGCNPQESIEAVSIPTPTLTPTPAPTVKVYEFRKVELGVYTFFPWHEVHFITPDGKPGRVRCILERVLEISCDVPERESMYMEVWVENEGDPIVNLIAGPPYCRNGAQIHLHKDHPLCS